MAFSLIVMELLLSLLVIQIPNISSFAPLQRHTTITQQHSTIQPRIIFHHPPPTQTPPSFKTTKTTTTILHQSNNNSNNQFNLSKPTFDLFSLRSIRGDALIKYSSLNQSEPLRINIYLLSTLISLTFPSISESLFGELPVPPLVVTLASLAASVASGALFTRECRRRGNQLTRIERELNAEYLSVTTCDKYGMTRRGVSLAELKDMKRVVAFCGSLEELRQVGKEFYVFRNRLEMGNALVVLVPTTSDGGVVSVGKREELIRAVLPEGALTRGEVVPWVATTGSGEEERAWRDYFKSLTMEEEGVGDDNGGGSLAWFGLTYSGKSFGSGRGVASTPKLLELMGSFLTPVDFLDESDKGEDCSGAEEEVIMAQKEFYSALTTGDVEGMNRVFCDETADEVTEVINAGGRIDNWKACLAEGARPEKMITSGSDAVIVSSREAYSTTVEFPANAGIDSATLLAAQKWERNDDGEKWKLVWHQTIPWSPETRAAGTLRCDCRGCVALTRSR